MKTFPARVTTPVASKLVFWKKAPSTPSMFEIDITGAIKLSPRAIVVDIAEAIEIPEPARNSTRTPPDSAKVIRWPVIPKVVPAR